MQSGDFARERRARRKMTKLGVQVDVSGGRL
jgi:hypothetical protein